MEKLITTVASSSDVLINTVLGATVVILLLVLVFLVKTFLSHISESDKRWSAALDRNTEALKGSNEALNDNKDAMLELAQASKESGDKIAMSIERALLYGRIPQEMPWQGRKRRKNDKTSEEG